MSPFGIFHTLLGLTAVTAGITAMVRHRQIGLSSRSGLTYVVFTVLTCVTGLFIFNHGGFGAPHALSILTLLVLAFAAWAERRGRAPPTVPRQSELASTTTLFFHFIPGLTETSTRLPAGKPLATGPEDPALAAAIGAVLLVFVVIGIAQWRRLRREHAGPATGALSPLPGKS